MKIVVIKIISILVLSTFLTACKTGGGDEQRFTIAVIPDTQNMVDFSHQNTENYPIDSAGMFIQQMQYLADNTNIRGGNIEFVTSVGDVWQHRENGVDPAHAIRGLTAADDSPKKNPKNHSGIQNFEIPLAKRGYNILAETGIPFSVVPGNHDYDWYWRDSRFPRQRDRFDELRDERGRIVRFDPTIIGMTHVGGLDNFRSVFSDTGPYFKNKSWYISSYNGGANSAQVFQAGGYKFLHLGLEMQSGDDVLDWAQEVINANIGIPTIISTHDFLTTDGERKQRINADYSRVDPGYHKATEEIWEEFIAVNDQIFMVLSGHNHAQSRRTDKNNFGNKVYQIMADYQDRGQSLRTDINKPPVALSDGWLRLMEFDMGKAFPVINVRTYSTYYKKFSYEIPEYASWYKKWEHPELSDEEFNAMDYFSIELTDFKERFDKN